MHSLGMEATLSGTSHLAITRFGEDAPMLMLLNSNGARCAGPNSAGINPSEPLDPAMRRRTKALVVVALIAVAFAGTFVFLPVIPARGPCAGGFGCVRDYSLSCSTLGFGSYDDFHFPPEYFLTSDCSGFVNH